MCACVGAVRERSGGETGERQRDKKNERCMLALFNPCPYHRYSIGLSRQIFNLVISLPVYPDIDTGLIPATRIITYTTPGALRRAIDRYICHFAGRCAELETETYQLVGRHNNGSLKRYLQALKPTIHSNTTTMSQEPGFLRRRFFGGAISGIGRGSWTHQT